MPRDKTATHEKLIPIVKQEFLQYGYEKASVNHIAELAGMSAAGLYRLWKDRSIEDHEKYDPFGNVWTADLLDFVYANFDALKLLICCSAGSKYENFEEQLIMNEEISSKAFAAELEKSGGSPMPVTDDQWHLVATLYVRAVTEIIRHDMPREQAEEHIAFIKEFLHPGMKRLYGLD